MKLPRMIAVLCGILLVSLASRAADPALQVATDHGIVEGKTQGAVRAFLGIPFAAPPVGELRWKPPMPAAKWDGVRSAKEFGPHPIQPVVWKDMIFRDSGESEDCLTLNVWTPVANSAGKLPVMVWIYGGGFTAGGSSEQRQDGTRLAQRGVVVVSMNYRLGLYGFLAHPELIAESPTRSAGNYGFLDQLAALKWVRANIAAFGGDPENVTIFGESAGSASVSAHMASPLSRGLIHRAIGESGALHYIAGSTRSEPLAARAATDAAFLRDKTGTATLAELRALPPEKLIAANPPPVGLRVQFWPNIDGVFLPQSATAIFAAGAQNDIPLLAGWNRDEGGLALQPTPPPVDVMRRTAQNDFGPEAEEFLRLYLADTPEQAARSGAELANDRFTAFGTWLWLELQAKTGRAPAYRFRFDRAWPNAPGTVSRGAFHSAEIVYVFGEFDAAPEVPWTNEDRRVSDLIQSYWVNFARTGNPNGPGFPNWPRYETAKDAPVMYLNSPSTAHADDFRARYLFLERVWKK